jgi:very-short-patch-repair endonuclease
MTQFFNRTNEKSLRRELRSNLAPAEVLLWSRLKGRQLCDCRFRRQYSVGPYVLDFYSSEIQVGIELDGDSHFQPGAAEYDTERQRFIESFGIHVVRFVNTEIYDNMEGVLQRLAEVVRRRREGFPL